MLIATTLSELGYAADPLHIAAASVPIAAASLLIGSASNLLFDRRLARLCIEDRYRLAAGLRKKYGLSISQLARLTMTDRKILASVLLKHPPKPLPECNP